MDARSIAALLKPQPVETWARVISAVNRVVDVQVVAHEYSIEFLWGRPGAYNRFVLPRYRASDVEQYVEAGKSSFVRPPHDGDMGVPCLFKPDCDSNSSDWRCGEIVTVLNCGTNPVIVKEYGDDHVFALSVSQVRVYKTEPETMTSRSVTV